MLTHRQRQYRQHNGMTKTKELPSVINDRQSVALEMNKHFIVK